MNIFSQKVNNGIGKKELALIYIILILVNDQSIAENKFYNDRERGWYYRECVSCEEINKKDKAKEREQLKEPRLSLREMDGDQVLAILGGVQKEMQVRQARYTLEPTLENARDFLDYQRLMFKNGSQASEVMKTVLIKYPYLDSRIENPISQQAIKIKTLELDKANDNKIKEFAQHFKLFYFFKSGCAYCQEFQPVLEKLIQVYGFKVEAISSEGNRLENSISIPASINNSLANKLKIETYPTIIAYNQNNNIYLPISRGFLPLEDLKLNILHAYSHIVNLSLEEK